MNNLKPLYKQEPIPQPHQSNNSLRNQGVVVWMRARTERFQSGFYPNCISEWSKFDPEISLAPSVAAFKEKLLSTIRPLQNLYLVIHDPIGLLYLTNKGRSQSRLNKLNLHKFSHNFRGVIDKMCPTDDGIENTEHFLLLCPSFDIQRRELLTGVSELLRPYVRINAFQITRWSKFC